MFVKSDLERSMRIDMLRGTLAELTTKALEISRLIDELSFPAQEAPTPSHAARAARHLRSQNGRAKFFPKEILRDYGWNMLLDLFVSQENGKKISVSSACLSSEGPATTALRWLDVLVKAGLISREADADDKRRIYVSVTPTAREQIINWLDHLK